MAQEHITVLTTSQSTNNLISADRFHPILICMRIRRPHTHKYAPAPWRGDPLRADASRSRQARLFALLVLMMTCGVSNTTSLAGSVPHLSYFQTSPSDLLVDVALKPGTVTHSRFTVLAPISPLVLFAQQMLSELDLYSGPLDGRLNDDVETAVRTFQRRSGMAPDGRIDERLVSRLEFAGQAGRLVGRLDDLRRQQQEQARAALASTAVTRSLLTGATRLGVADPTRNTSACLSEPTVPCLLRESIEAAKAINRPHFRDWVLGEVVSVQARTDAMAGALATAGLIDDPRLVIVALKRMVAAAADADQIDTAETTAALIPDAWVRTEARISIVSAYLRHGRIGQARSLATRIESEVLVADGGRSRASVLLKLAGALIGGGSVTGATQTLEKAVQLVRGSANEQPPDAGGPKAIDPDAVDIASIAAGFARVGRIERARQLFSEIDDESYRETALIEAAGSRAATGDVRGARAYADAIQTPRFHLAALIRIAEAHRDRGRQREAVSILPVAVQASTRIGDGLNYARSDALSRVATLWATLGDPDQAMTLAGRISDDRVRSSTMWAAAAIVKASDSISEHLERTASRQTERVASTLDRVWILANAAAAFAAAARPSTARGLFDRGLRIAAEMKSPWGRAQALVKLADVLHLLERSGPVEHNRDQAK